MSLYQDWLDAKAIEHDATEKRRAIEDELFALHKFDADSEGTEKAEIDGFKLTISKRFNRSVDSDLLQEIAAENGLTEHLSSLFRWKPELNMTAWKAADQSITNPLCMAITTKPGRATFKIEKL